jgi:hypothetical protein
MINVFAGKVRKTGFFQKAGFPGSSERIFGIYYNQVIGSGTRKASGTMQAAMRH